MSLLTKINISLLQLIFIAITLSAAEADDARIKFPENYKNQLINYLSLDRSQNEDQIIRLFAPKEALEAAKSGKQLPDGTVLVGEIYKAKKNSEGKVIKSALGRRIRSKLAAIAVMEKRKGWGDKFPAELKNGDWDFAVFSTDGKRLVKKDLNACRSCHAPLTDMQHLFSFEHLKN